MEGRRHASVSGTSSYGQPSLIPLNLNSLISGSPENPQHDRFSSSSSHPSSNKSPSTPGESGPSPSPASFCFPYSANIGFSNDIPRITQSPSMTSMWDRQKGPFISPAMVPGPSSDTATASETIQPSLMMDKRETPVAVVHRMEPFTWSVQGISSVERRESPATHTGMIPPQSSGIYSADQMRSPVQNIFGPKHQHASIDMIGMKHLLSWAGDLARFSCTSHSDLMDGRIILSLMNIIFPKACHPCNQHMTSTERWQAVTVCAARVALPHEWLDWTGVSEGKFDAAYVILATFFFLHGLLGSASFSVDLELPIQPELAQFLRSKRSVESLSESACYVCMCVCVCACVTENLTCTCV